MQCTCCTTTSHLYASEAKKRSLVPTCWLDTAALRVVDICEYAAERAAAGRAIKYVATDITRRKPVGALRLLLPLAPFVA